jgi:hypothetical protein
MNEYLSILLTIEGCIFVIIWFKIVIYGIHEQIRIVRERFLPLSERPFPLPPKRLAIPLLIILVLMVVTYYLWQAQGGKEFVITF